jgi:hypothetical protein
MSGVDLNTNAPPALYLAEPLSIKTDEIVIKGQIALKFNADGSVTCYPVSVEDSFSLPTDALVAYWAICRKPVVHWKKSP